jgi:hypothetical protein
MIRAAFAQFIGDVVRNVPRPAFGDIESDDANRVVILAVQQIRNDGFEVGVLYGRPRAMRARARCRSRRAQDRPPDHRPAERSKGTDALLKLRRRVLKHGPALGFQGRVEAAAVPGPSTGWMSGGSARYTNRLLVGCSYEPRRTPHSTHHRHRRHPLCRRLRRGLARARRLAGS